MAGSVPAPARTTVNSSSSDTFGIRARFCSSPTVLVPQLLGRVGRQVRQQAPARDGVVGLVEQRIGAADLLQLVVAALRIGPVRKEERRSHSMAILRKHYIVNAWSRLSAIL